MRIRVTGAPGAGGMLARALLALLPLALLAPAASAVVSPSGVDWSLHHVLCLESDDLGSAEFMFSATASTRYGLNVPWNGAQWSKVATAIRGHQDGLGVQVPLTLYVVASYMEPDFTPVSSSSSQVFDEDFSGALPEWTTYGSNPPVITTTTYVSPPASAQFDTPTAASDGWARRWVPQCKEYKVTFWYRLERVDARTHLVSLAGPMGRYMGIEAQSLTGKLYLREAYYTDELLHPIGNYETGVWRKISFKQVGNRVDVDMNDDGTIELSRPAAFLPTLANQVLLGDFSTDIYSGRGEIDDLVLTRWDNVYPDSPRVTPIDLKFPDAVAAVNANPDIYVVLSHDLTHGNNAEVQRRYANGLVDTLSMPEANWWREDFDAVQDRPLGVLPQYQQFTQALDILERSFGHRPDVHVTPGNVYGNDTDAALEMAGVHFHETQTSGAGLTSLDDPAVFWSVRTGEQELFYQLPDPDPFTSAALAAAQVDSLIAGGQPVVLQTHAMNALVDGDGAALATYYSQLLATAFARHPELTALGMEEVSQLERDGWSASGIRANRIYARNYLASSHEFHVTIPESLMASSVLRLPSGAPVVFARRGNEVVFQAGSGDYLIMLQPAQLARVGAPASPAAPVSLTASPNPASGRVALTAQLPSRGPLSLEVVDLQGRRIFSTRRDDCPAGANQFIWDGLDQAGRRAAPGLYFARLQWTAGSARAKILLVP